eukprot:866978-Pyramimonas_sp.AAC.1
MPLEPSVEFPMRPLNAVMGGGDARGHCHWSLRWNFIWGRETLSWVAVTHTNASTWAFGEVPYGATNLVKGVP